MFILNRMPRGTVFYVSCVIISLTILLSFNLSKAGKVSADAVAAPVIGIYCSPIPQSGTTDLVMTHFIKNSDGSQGSAMTSGQTVYPNTGITIHALGTATGSCIPQDCTQAGAGSNCAPGACQPNPTNTFLRKVFKIVGNFTANCENLTLNNGVWNIGTVFGKYPGGATAFYPVLDTHDNMLSTGPLGLGLFATGVYYLNYDGPVDTTPCNLTPSVLPLRTFEVFVDKEMHQGCMDCKTSVGKPVTVTNGNMYLDQQDYGSESLGDGLRVVRAYNSLSSSAGMFGAGWSNNLEAKVQQLGTRYIRLKWGDGGATYFELQNNGKYLPRMRRGSFIEIVRELDGTYTLWQKGGGKNRFSAAGRLTAILDKNDNATTLTRDASNRITGLTDAVNNTLTFAYPDANATRVSTLSDATGVVATYTYYGGTLATVTYKDGSKYIFEQGIVGSFFALTKVKDALNKVLEAHTYDLQRRALTSELDGGVEKYTLSYPSDTSTEVTDGLGRKTVYTIDKKRTVWAVTNIEGQCACGSGGNESQAFTYNQYGELLTQTNALSEITSFTYDSVGNRLTTTNPLGTTAFTYDNLGQVKTVTDPMGGITTNTFDVKGNLLQQQDASGVVVKFGTPNAQGLPPTYTDSRNNVTNLTYDAQGRLWKLTDPNGKITTLEYWSRGWQKSVTTPLGFTTSFTYDLVGRLKTVTDPAGHVTTNTYNLAGQLIKVTDAKLKDTIYTYDGAYRLTSVKDALNRTTTYGYDLMSNMTSATDDKGRVTVYEPDSFNRVKKITYPAATAGGTGLFETFEYDKLGRIKKHVDRALRETQYGYAANYLSQTVTDPAGQITTVEFNQRRHRTAVVDAKSQRYDFEPDQVGRVKSTTYGGRTMSFMYEGGLRKTRTDFKGVVTTYGYDLINRLNSISYSSGGSSSYGYDDDSRLTSATNANGTVAMAYNSRSMVESVTDVFGETISYLYDQNGNRQSASYGGSTLSYQYDFINRVKQITHNSVGTTTYDYDLVNPSDSQSRMHRRTLPNGVVVSAELDRLDRVKKLTHVKGTNWSGDYRYTYNATDQITQMEEIVNPVIEEPGPIHSFIYDNLQRLTTEGHTNQPSQGFSYDQVGNRTNAPNNIAPTYSANNRLMSYNGLTFGYDLNGNRETQTSAAGTTVYGYDSENRLSSVLLPDLTIVQYKYDALGRRVERSRNGGNSWERFSYDGADVVKDVRSDGVTIEYGNGLGIDDKLWQKEGASAAKFFTVDHLGSTRALTDANGAATEFSFTDAFGNGAASAVTRYGYTGREADAETGLMYYRARFYDPVVGRFVSEDPIGLEGGTNLFAYVENDASNSIDRIPSAIGRELAKPVA